MKTMTVFLAGMLIAGPVLAQTGEVPVPAEVPQACAMMYKGTMDHSKMDYGARSGDARYRNNRVTKDATATTPIESQIATPCSAIFRKG